MSNAMSTEEKTPQRYKLNPQKPSVRKLLSHVGMWWAEVMDSNGEYQCACFYYHADALAKAYEYAAMNAEATK